MDSASSEMMTENDEQDDDYTPERKRRRLFGLDAESQSEPAVNNSTNYNDDGDAGDLQPMTKVFGISLIMDNMFKYLTFEDTRSSVLVSQSWYAHFGYLLDKWTVFRIHFDMTSRLKIKVEERRAGLYYKIYIFGTLEELEIKLNSVQNKTIKITESAHTNQDVAFKDLLTRLSPWISYASCDCKRGTDTMQLVSRLKNLVCLHIGSICGSSHPEVPLSSFPANNFHRLTTIHFLHTSFISEPAFIENLLLAAPNLKKIFDYPLRCANVLQQVPQECLDKIASFNHKESLTFSENDMISLGLLSTFCRSSSIQLERIKIDFTEALSSWNWTEGCDIFSSLLSSNSGTLETLQLYPLVKGHSLKFPAVFPKLSNLHFYFPFSLRNFAIPIKTFPKDFDPNLLFPNVTNVILHWDLRARQFDNWFFGGQNNKNKIIFPQVRCLDLQLPFGCDEPLTIDEVKSISSVFPNLDSLTVKIGGDLWMDLLLAIWRLWPHLQQLTIEVQVTEETFCKRFFLDEIFTGIPEAKCKSLRANNNNNNLSQQQIIDNIEELRNRPAISTMTRLEGLKIVFNERIFTRSADLLPPFSPVTVQYGFNLLPQLQVTFAIGKCFLNKEKMKKMLKPIIPLIDFVPDYWQ